MPVFNYQARTKDGELQVGTVEAGSKETAIDVLQRHNLIVVHLEEKSREPVFYKKLEFLETISEKEVALFSRQLATLLDAQVPLVEALKALGAQTKNPKFKGVIFEISSDIEGGTLLSKALEKHPKIFSHFYRALLRSAEVAGKLQEVTLYLAEHLERDHQIKSKIRGALIYPAFIFFGIIIVVTLMFVFVVPQLIAIFEDVEVELPFITKVIINLSSFFRRYVLIILFFLGISIFGFGRYIKTEEGKNFIDAAKLKLPIFGNIFTNFYIARFTENLGTLLTGGISISIALRVSADVIENRVYERIIKETEKAVTRGDTISSVLKECPEIPPLVSQMVATGETTGKLDVILKNLARFYEGELDTMVENLLTLIEPILIVAMGISVGILVIAILQPIYSMVQAF